MPLFFVPHPTGLHVQPRDRDLLEAVKSHRFVLSHQLHSLVAPEVSLRVVQSRLYKLATHGYLKRWYLPQVLDGQHAPSTHSRQPIYALTTRGALLLREAQCEPDAPVTRCRPPERPSPVTLQHHLVVVDVLVALAVAGRTSGAVSFLGGVHDGVLYAQLRKFRQHHHVQQAVVPDGAFTLGYGSRSPALTFYLEVVRADVKAGNASLLAKMQRYVELMRSGFFRDAYGHERIRAVLFATTSAVRARNLCRVAARLQHGRRLFWFGSYQAADQKGVLRKCLSPATILNAVWSSPDGELFTLAQPTSPPRERQAG